MAIGRDWTPVTATNGVKTYVRERKDASDKVVSKTTFFDYNGNGSFDACDGFVTEGEFSEDDACALLVNYDASVACKETPKIKDASGQEKEVEYIDVEAQKDGADVILDIDEKKQYQLGSLYEATNPTSNTSSSKKSSHSRQSRSSSRNNNHTDPYQQGYMEAMARATTSGLFNSEPNWSKGFSTPYNYEDAATNAGAMNMIGRMYGNMMLGSDQCRNHIDKSFLWIEEEEMRALALAGAQEELDALRVENDELHSEIDDLSKRVKELENKGTTPPPAGTTQQPAGTTQQPAGTTQQPAGTTQQPAGTTQQPAGTTQQPAGTTQQPAGTTQQPAGTTQQPAETTPTTPQTEAEKQAEESKKLEAKIEELNKKINDPKTSDADKEAAKKELATLQEQLKKLKKGQETVPQSITNTAVDGAKKGLNAVGVFKYIPTVGIMSAIVGAEINLVKKGYNAIKNLFSSKDKTEDINKKIEALNKEKETASDLRKKAIDNEIKELKAKL